MNRVFTCTVYAFYQPNTWIFSMEVHWKCPTLSCKWSVTTTLGKQPNHSLFVFFTAFDFKRITVIKKKHTGAAASNHISVSFVPEWSRMSNLVNGFVLFSHTILKDGNITFTEVARGPLRVKFYIYGVLFVRRYHSIMRNRIPMIRKKIT